MPQQGAEAILQAAAQLMEPEFHVVKQNSHLTDPEYLSTDWLSDPILADENMDVKGNVPGNHNAYPVVTTALTEMTRNSSTTARPVSQNHD
ncbi:hypothetical protein [Amycolatopsis magusensis]|uniref:hypothetical protein n=1 Tax=Amycolatopsis magusensis TaxID=882444 RepID=UPI001FDAB331|nr:hypothetical protein [Amycolatopsis magusensis]